VEVVQVAGLQGFAIKLVRQEVVWVDRHLRPLPKYLGT
jgi:hypothetical protein